MLPRGRAAPDAVETRPDRPKCAKGNSGKLLPPQAAASQHPFTMRENQRANTLHETLRNPPF